MSATPISFATRDYRGATVEDLNMAQAISINPSTSLYDALAVGYEYDFTFLPVIDEETKRLLGVINVEDMRNAENQVKNSFLAPVVRNYMVWFNQTAKKKYESRMRQGATSTQTSKTSKILKPRGKRYEVLTPYSPLEQLAKFFNQGNYFAIITGGDGDFVYGVVTPEDLKKYEQARPKL
ncbi:hypothetical protein Cantr_02847 [Candida viswanathii]|uniref:CBS domain-containing protein n=1 Tax=Candida viswanathii TaxID=5486 RepID=A0A367YPK6_9ASCO|nr:hypothetical protein Cantr_02847 [Candida viswanathii]